MDKSLLMYRGGVRSIKKKLSDGNEHTLYYKAKTPLEILEFGAAREALGTDQKAVVEIHRLLTNWIASSLCTETGEAQFTFEQAELIPNQLKSEIAHFILTGSSETGADVGKD